VLERFLNLPVIVETSAGPVIGVLLQFDLSEHGGVGNLLVHGFIGSWTLVKSWVSIKRI
jgi:hypothetical protein